MQLPLAGYAAALASATSTSDRRMAQPCAQSPSGVSENQRRQGAQASRAINRCLNATGCGSCNTSSPASLSIRAHPVHTAHPPAGSPLGWPARWRSARRCASHRWSGAGENVACQWLAQPVPSAGLPLAHALNPCVLPYSPPMPPHPPPHLLYRRWKSSAKAGSEKTTATQAAAPSLARSRKPRHASSTSREPGGGGRVGPGLRIRAGLRIRTACRAERTVLVRQALPTQPLPRRPTLDVLCKPLLQRLGKLQALVVAPHVVVDHLRAVDACTC